MFERFTERARQVVVLAQEEARALRHNYIGTEHILLGLLREEAGVGAAVLQSLGVSIGDARAHVVRLVGSGEEVATGQIPFTPRAKKTLEIANREALSLGHNYIGTEHILLALARANEGVAARVLSAFDADPEGIRQAVSSLLPASEGGSHASVAMVSSSQLRFAVTPNRELRRVLMAAAGRALTDERSEFGLDDLLAAIAARGDGQKSKQGEAADAERDA